MCLKATMSLYLEIPVYRTCVPGASGCHLAYCIILNFCWLMFPYVGYILTRPIMVFSSLVTLV
jgi:hypothetical protein